MIFEPGKIPLKEETPVDPQGGLVQTWSYSTLKNFEDCQHKVYLNKIVKVASEQHPAALRGTEIHDLAEQYIKGELNTLPKELNKFDKDFLTLQERYSEGTATAEEPWGFDINWVPVDWMHPEVWCRMKLDAFVQESETSAVVIDFKTGRKEGNEISHISQAQVYAIGALMRDPELEFIKIRFFYLDKGGELQKEYTREYALRLLPRWIQRAIALTSATDFLPMPSTFKCRFCNYNKECEWSAV